MFELFALENDPNYHNSSKIAFFLCFASSVNLFKILTLNTFFFAPVKVFLPCLYNYCQQNNLFFHSFQNMERIYAIQKKTLQYCE